MNVLRVAFVAAVASALSSAAAQTGKLTLSSPDIKAGGTIPNAQAFNGMDCTGNNISPALSWTGAPANTKSFALTVYDPDAPTGSGWWHWVVYNIPANATKLASGAGDPAKKLLPTGAVEGYTDFGQPGYGGPCPPKGDKPHHYHFALYALDVDKIQVPANATAAMVGFNLHAHQLAKAELTALYGR
jgi:hypothetical protein